MRQIIRHLKLVKKRKSGKKAIIYKNNAKKYCKFFKLIEPYKKI